MPYPTNVHLTAQGENLDRLYLGMWTKTVHPKTFGSRDMDDGISVNVDRISKGVLKFRMYVGSRFSR